jgi:hypothetical protein
VCDSKFQKTTKAMWRKFLSMCGRASYIRQDPSLHSWRVGEITFPLPPAPRDLCMFTITFALYFRLCKTHGWEECPLPTTAHELCMFRSMITSIEWVLDFQRHIPTSYPPKPSYEKNLHLGRSLIKIFSSAQTRVFLPKSNTHRTLHQTHASYFNWHQTPGLLCGQVFT